MAAIASAIFGGIGAVANLAGGITSAVQQQQALDQQWKIAQGQLNIAQQNVDLQKQSLDLQAWMGANAPFIQAQAQAALPGLVASNLATLGVDSMTARAAMNHGVAFQGGASYGVNPVNASTISMNFTGYNTNWGSGFQSLGEQASGWGPTKSSASVASWAGSLPNPTQPSWGSLMDLADPIESVI